MILHCKHCGGEFGVRKNGRNMFCSISCSSSYNNKRRTLKPRIRVKIPNARCGQCNKELSRRTGKICFVCHNINQKEAAAERRRKRNA